MISASIIWFPDIATSIPGYPCYSNKLIKNKSMKSIGICYCHAAMLEESDSMVHIVIVKMKNKKENKSRQDSNGSQLDKPSRNFTCLSPTWK